MRHFVKWILIIALFTTPIGSGSGKSNKQPDINRTSINFYKSDYITHIVYNRHMLCIYFDNRDMLILVCNKTVFNVLAKKGRMNTLTIYVEPISLMSIVRKMCKQKNLQLYDPNIDLEFVVLKDKINFILQKADAILIRMVNGFSMSIRKWNILPNSYFIHRFACEISILEKDWNKLVEWVGGKNGKKNGRK